MRLSAVVVAGAVLLGALLGSGCGPGAPSGTPGSPVPAGAEGDGRGRAAAGPSPTGHGEVFLAVGECSSSGSRSFVEVPCTGERAVARVTARHEGRPTGGPACPANTDFVLHVSDRGSASDEDGDGVTPRGYACMRNLQPPHPGDPGGGGGPLTVAGDCVHGTGEGEVRETACDGTGEHAPEFEVTRAVTDRDRCPASTDLYVRLGGDRPVGCAREL
ncbi:hypothetical protein [Streptomyces sp. NPDC005012]|uniref:hypothetical protein n=1 Tax=Streptomyces sp. NPDC005012 TaxID=3154558 RepID=UPI0033A46F4D